MPLLAILNVLFLLAYLIYSGVWIRSDRDKDNLPILLFVSAVLGLFLGVRGMFFLQTTIFIRFLGETMGSIGASLVLLLYFVIPVLLSALMVFAAQKIKIRKPSSLLGRASILLAGFCLLLIPFIFTLSKPVSSFPGASASIMARDQWARRTFHDSYEDALQFLQLHPEVRKEIGLITDMAPTDGVNRVMGSPGDTIAIFSMEVIGEKSKALVNMSCQYKITQSPICKANVIVRNKTVVISEISLADLSSQVSSTESQAQSNVLSKEKLKSSF